MSRRAGVLLHPSSLPGPYGIGDIGPGAVRFLDWAAIRRSLRLAGIAPGPDRARELPLQRALGLRRESAPDVVRVDGGGGAFGRGNARRGPGIPGGPGRLSSGCGSGRSGCCAPRGTRCETAATPRRGRRGTTLRAFAEAPERAAWLSDWTLYAAIKERQDGSAWEEWYPPVARRVPGRASRRRSAPWSVDRDYHAFVQWLFARTVAAPPRSGARARDRDSRRHADLPRARFRGGLGAAGSLHAGRERTARGGRGRAARLLQRHGAALGESALPLGSDGGGRVRVVDCEGGRRARDRSTECGSITSEPSRPTGRCRRGPRPRWRGAGSPGRE